ncbi:hypothetical protein F5Y09DRAFT_303404 [Xylaria sp. FL1042]|nr:hypothetical protein F5Y09DRAFT_303404 [Xylaria sp. FL1042]
MLRSLATALLLAATGIHATTDGDFGTWHVVAAEPVCDGIYGCRQSFSVTSDGNSEHMLPGFSATCSNLGGCSVDDGESRLELSNNCVPGGVSLKQTVENATNVWAAWGYASWQDGTAGEFTIPVSKLHIYGE